MAGFNLTAQINLQGPGNVKKVVAGIQKQLNGLKADVNLNINPATIKTLQNANKKLTAINASLNKVSTSAGRANSAVGQFAKTINSIGTGNVAVKVQAVSKATQQLGKNSSIAFKNIKIARTEIEEFGRQSALAIRRFTAFAGVTSVIYGVNNAINQALGDFVKFDRQLVRISQVSGQTVNNLKGLQSTIGELATGIGVSSSSLAQISVTLTQAGFSIRDVQKALKALALTDVAPTFNNLNDTVEGSIALLRQFSIGAGQLEGALGSINAVAARFAVESSDIIAAIQRAGGVFSAASKGVSEGTEALNQFIAVFTSVRATTREGAETIATGLRTIFTRLQRESTIDALKEFGVNLQDAEGKFVGAFKAVKLLSEGLGTLDPRDIRFSKIVEELGGFRQIGKVIPLIGQFATAQEALKVAQQGQASLAESNAKAQQALAIQFAKVREEFLQLVRNVAGTDSFKGLISGALSLASALIKVADSVKGIIPILGLLGAARGVSAIGQFAKGFGGGLTRTQGFARGGKVPGSGNTDSVPAMLTPGEFVLRKSSVRAIGTEKLHRMNRYGNGGKEDGRLLKAEPGTAFTHLTKSKAAGFSYTAKSGKKKNISRLYDSFGLDLPANWNSDWNLKANNIGVSAAALREYIKNNDVFKTLKGKTNASKLYGLEGGQSGAAGQALNKQYPSIKRKIMAGLPTGSAFFDTDPDVIKKLKPIVDAALGSSTLRKAMKQKSVGLDGKKRIRLPRGKRKATGGSIQDTVPAMLTPGEFVINAKSAKAVGYGNLRKMNTRPQGFNKGGVVGFANGGLTGVSGSAGGTLRFGSSEIAALMALEAEFDALGLSADKLTQLLSTKGKADARTYVAAKRQIQSNIALAKASAKTTAERAKATAMEKQLAAVERKRSNARRGGTGALSNFAESGAFTSLIIGAGTAAVALEQLNTPITSAASAFITTMATLTTTVLAAIPVFETLAKSKLLQSIGNTFPGLGRLGGTVAKFAKALGPAAIAAGAVAAGFAAVRAYQKKQIELAKKAAQSKLDDTTKTAGDALKKFTDQANAANFNALNNAINDQIAAGKEFAVARRKQLADESQNTTGFRGTSRGVFSTLTLGLLVDSIEEATLKNKDKVTAAAREIVEANSAAFTNAQNAVMEQFAKGKTLGDFKGAAPGSAEAKALDALVDAALEADQTYQEQVALATQQGRTLGNAAIAANRQRVKNDLLAANGSLALKDKTEQAARAQERLNRLQVKLATSFVQLNSVMQQSIARIQQEAAVRQDSIDASIARARGQASITEIRSRAASVVDNPSAFTPGERNATRGRLAQNLTPALGRQRAREVSAVATFDPAVIEKGFADVINNIAPGASADQASKDIRAGVAEQLKSLRAAGAGDVADNLQEQADAIATNLSNSLVGVRDSNERRNKLDKAIEDLQKNFAEVRKESVDLAKAFSEARAAALNQFAKNVQEAANLQNEALKYEQAAIDATRNASDSIKEALTGFGPDVQELLNRGLADMESLTGGVSDPAAIADNFARLNAEASALEEQLRNNTDRTAEQANLVSRLAEVNRELNNNKAALEKLAESATKAADAALAEVNERKRLQEANRKFAETLLTSGPDELRAMDEALVRANQRLNGFIPQAGANQRKRFFELLKQTGSVRQASQGVAAETRRQDLKFLQQTRDIRISRMMDAGLSREAATDRANQDESKILRQMGLESGLGALGQSIVEKAVRDTADPKADPVMQKLVASYESAAAVQVEANTYLADIASGAANQALIDSQSNLEKSIRDLDATFAGADRRTRPAGTGAAAQNPSRRPQFRAAGGSIFRPQGTDTVPAMLTPGEFVVNRKAAQKNMGLLQSINGGKVSGYSNGGKVLYLRGGGFAQRDTNKDGVITVGVEDASGLNDSNNDGVITFAEYMANQALTDPKARDYINKTSNNMQQKYNKNISPLNVLKNEQYYDNIELFGPINDELQGYINDSFEKDNTDYNKAKEENKDLNEKIRKLNGGKDFQGDSIPKAFHDTKTGRELHKLLQERAKNNKTISEIGNQKDFKLASMGKGAIGINDLLKLRQEKIRKLILSEGINDIDAAEKVDAEMKEGFEFTPQQGELYQRMVERAQTIQAVQGGGGGIREVKQAHKHAYNKARSAYFKRRQELIDSGVPLEVATQRAMNEYGENYMNFRDQWFKDNAAKIKEKEGPQKEKPFLPVNPVMDTLRQEQEETNRANAEEAAKQAAEIRAEEKAKRDEAKKEAERKEKQRQRMHEELMEQERQREEFESRKRLKEEEEKNRRMQQKQRIKAGVNMQRDLLNEKIASKQEELDNEKEIGSGAGFLGRGIYDAVIDWSWGFGTAGEGTQNWKLKSKILSQELAALKMARDEVQNVIDSGYSPKVLAENYSLPAAKSGHSFNFKVPGSESTRRTMGLSERAGVITSAEDKRMLDSTMQGIQVSRDVAESAIQAIGMIATMGLSAVPKLATPLFRSGGTTLLRSMGIGGAEGGITSLIEEMLGATDSKSTGQSATNVAVSTGFGLFGPVLGKALGNMLGRIIPKRTPKIKPLGPDDILPGTGVARNLNVNPKKPLGPTLDPLEENKRQFKERLEYATNKVYSDEEIAKILDNPFINSFTPGRPFRPPKKVPVNEPTVRPPPRSPARQRPAGVRPRGNATDRLYQMYSEQQTQMGADLAQYASSPEKAALLRQRSASVFGVKQLDIQEDLAVGGTRAGGAYFPGNQKLVMDKRTLSGPQGRNILRHEMTHAFQQNTLQYGRNRERYYAGVRGLEGYDAFLAEGGGYEQLRGSLRGAIDNKNQSVGNMYSAKEIRDKPVELLTSLVQASNSEQFQNNPAAKDMLKKLMKLHGYASGGHVGLFHSPPRGTDTVPAMLTPGEFVVNRNATSKFLPVLRAINNGYSSHNQMVNHLAKGGVAGGTQYLQNGGLAGAGSNNGVSVNSQIQGIEEFKTIVAQLNQAISGGTENMNSVVTQITQASNSFSATAQSVNEAATNIPDSVSVAQNLRVDGIPDTLDTFSNNLLNSSVSQSQQDTASKFNDLNTKNEGSLGLQSPNNNEFIT